MDYVNNCILMLLLIIPITSCSGESKESSADALGAVYYLTFGVADGDTENLGGSKYTYESTSPGELLLKLEDGEIRSKVSHVEGCRYIIERTTSFVGSQEQTRQSEIDFHTLVSVDQFAKQGAMNSTWRLNFSDGCATKEVGLEGTCRPTWGGIGMVVDEKRLQAAFAYFKKDVCPGQKF